MGAGMNDDFSAGCVIGFVITFIAMLVSILFIVSCNNELWQAEAVKQGKAEYYLDYQNTRKWRWKEVSQ